MSKREDAAAQKMEDLLEEHPDVITITHGICGYGRNLMASSWFYRKIVERKTHERKYYCR